MSREDWQNRQAEISAQNRYKYTLYPLRPDLFDLYGRGNLLLARVACHRFACQSFKLTYRGGAQDRALIAKKTQQLEWNTFLKPYLPAAQADNSRKLRELWRSRCYGSDGMSFASSQMQRLVRVPGKGERIQSSAGSTRPAT
jgi:hypothetical protein